MRKKTKKVKMVHVEEVCSNRMNSNVDRYLVSNAAFVSTSLPIGIKLDNFLCVTCPLLFTFHAQSLDRQKLYLFFLLYCGNVWSVTLHKKEYERGSRNIQIKVCDIHTEEKYVKLLTYRMRDRKPTLYFVVRDFFRC